MPSLITMPWVLEDTFAAGGLDLWSEVDLVPLDPFYRDPSWSHITDWKAELAPYYDQAKRMLGVVENPTETPSDAAMRRRSLLAAGTGGAFVREIDPVVEAIAQAAHAQLGVSESEPCQHNPSDIRAMIASGIFEINDIRRGSD